MRRFWTAFLVVSAVVVNGCRKDTEKAPEAQQVPAPQVEAQAEEATAQVGGGMTDDLWVELMARRHCLVAKHAALAKTEPAAAREKIAREWGTMCTEAGITPQEWEAWTDTLAENPRRYTQLVKRASERVDELKAQERQ